MARVSVKLTEYWKTAAHRFVTALYAAQRIIPGGNLRSDNEFGMAKDLRHTESPDSI